MVKLAQKQKRNLCKFTVNKNLLNKKSPRVHLGDFLFNHVIIIQDMKRKVAISVGEYYHIYNRGVEKRDVFVDGGDYRRFMLLLNIFNEEKPVCVRDFKEKLKFRKPRGSTSGEETFVDIGAYCLMPNHFHILIKEKGKME